MSDDELPARVVQGDVRAAARACRIVDERAPGWYALLEQLYPHAQHAWLVGVTGAPGVGKSSLVDRLVQEARARKLRVGVVAIDPTSPFSGGAILGDRIRMQRHFADRDVFIRSLATRGALGGLSRSASAVARVLAAWGADLVLIETVGVGQDELDIMRLAHTTAVVMAPGAGDDIQAAKAGLLECADVFAVNKADLPGAEAAAQQLRAMLALNAVRTLGERVSGHGHGMARAAPAPAEERAHAAPHADEGTSRPEAWEVPVVLCSAGQGQGIAELFTQLEQHRAWLQGSEAGRTRRAARLREEFWLAMRDALVEAALARHAEAIEEAVEAVVTGASDPYNQSRSLAERIARGADE